MVHKRDGHVRAPTHQWHRAKHLDKFDNISPFILNGMWYLNVLTYVNRKIWKKISLPLSMPNDGTEPLDAVTSASVVMITGLFRYGMRPVPEWLTHWGRHKMDAISQTTCSNTFSWIKKVWISIKISLNFDLKDPINNIPALVQIMAWRRPGDKPLSELMMHSLLTHICVTRHQWVKAYSEI